MTRSHDPIVCSLSAKEASRQGLDWSDLKLHALAAEPIDGGAAMTFKAELADRVEDLAARERSCCDFLSITTKQSRDELRLEIRSDNPAARPVIEAMAGVGGQ